MSTLEPFTKKLLERVEAKKQQRQGQRNVPISATRERVGENQRSPLKETTNSHKETLQIDNTKSTKKRQSSEGVSNIAVEKKAKLEDIYLSEEPKEAVEEKVFSHRCGLHHEYVVPSNAGRTPMKVSVGASLKSRLANLNNDYNKRFELDQQEFSRRNEAEILKEQREKEHKKIVEEERARRIQEKIFGKIAQENKIKENKEEPSLVKVTAGSKKSVQHAQSAAKHGKSTPKQKVKHTMSAPPENALTKHKAKPNELKDVCNSKDGAYLEKEKEYEARKRKVTESRKLAAEDEKLHSASVGDKKFIFEQKMKLEREARLREIETENRLRQKTPRTENNCEKRIDTETEVPKRPAAKVVSMDVDSNINVSSSSNSKITNSPAVVSPMDVNSKTNVNSPSLTKMEQDIAKTIDEIEAAANEIEKENTKKKSIEGTPKNSGGMMKHVRATPKLSNAAATTPRESEGRSSEVKTSEIKTPSLEAISESTKNFTGDINSPQPVDYTHDTELSDPFDISEILHIAEDRSKMLSPKKSVGTPQRSSTMKVASIHAPFMKPMPDIDLTPILPEEYEDEEASEFTKAIREKKKSMRTKEQQVRLHEIDYKVNEKQAKSIPQKPPRASRSQPPSYEQFLIEKHEKEPKQIIPTGRRNEKQMEVEIQLNENNNDENFLKTKQTTPKKLRRSASFSEGQRTPVKSGYNKENDKYEAHRSSFDKPDIVYSKREQIQNLLEEAACQQNIVLQTSQALNVAEQGHEDKRGSPEVIEGERLLLLATEKRTVCLHEVNELKETDSIQFLNEIDQIAPCKATLALTDLRLPLHRDFVSALRAGKMDLGVFHFVVIASCGSKNVFSTKVSSTYDQLDGNSLVLNGDIFMRNVPHDFTVTVRVFGLHTKKINDQTNRLKKNHVNAQSPGNLKNLFKKNKDEEYINNASPQTVFRTSNFKLVGETKINLGLLGYGGKYVLTKVPSNCPLDGSIQLRVGCKPEFTANASGFLTILEDVGGYTAWNRRWCILKESQVLCWRYPDDEDTKEPLKTINLRYCTNEAVSLLSRDKCARPHTFELSIKRSAHRTDVADLITTIDGKYTNIKHWVCADNKEDRLIWMEAINRQLADARAWLLKRTKSSSGSHKEMGKAIPV